VSAYPACSSLSYIKSRRYLTSNRVKGVYVVKWKQFWEKISYVLKVFYLPTDAQ